MTAPALSRAARDLCLADTDVQIHELSHDYPCPACVEEAKTAVSAALHDPDDPDWLARHLAERDGCENVFGDVPAFLTGSIEKIRNDYRRQAAAFVAAILGEAS